MNPFASPEEASHYEFPEFPKPEEQATEYANIEGAVGYQLRDFTTSEAFNPADASTPVVQPVVFQDFKEVLTATQA